eukprot:4140930-Pleurochrysis_carterae.AAC.2
MAKGGLSTPCCRCAPCICDRGSCVDGTTHAFCWVPAICWAPAICCISCCGVMPAARALCTSGGNAAWILEASASWDGKI